MMGNETTENVDDRFGGESYLRFSAFHFEGVRMYTGLVFFTVLDILAVSLFFAGRILNE